jgi:T5orf172 domain
MEDLKIVYVLTNPAMPGLVKIGYTTQDDANTRIGQLYTTGVPVPFELEFACKVKNAEEVEKALHIAFSPYRINPKREFFQIEPSQAIAILQLLHVEDATKEVVQQPSDIDQQSIVAAQKMKNRAPNLNFEEMEIPINSELKSVRSEICVTVVTPKKVKLGEEEMSLTAATSKVLGIEYKVRPGSHWTYKGKLLQEIYNETYGESE